VIKWTAVHEYCNVDLHLYNLIFVLVAYEAVSQFLELSPPEKDCSFVNIPDRSLSDIARLVQTIKYKLFTI
jgi:hypothetical protein